MIKCIGSQFDGLEAIIMEPHRPFHNFGACKLRTYKQTSPHTVVIALGPEFGVFYVAFLIFRILKLS